MGSCISIKNNPYRSSLKFCSSQTTKTSWQNFQPPPCLSKANIYQISEPAKITKKEVSEYLCSRKVNKLLRKNEKARKIVIEFITKNCVENTMICELAGDFLEILYKEEKNLEEYTKPKIFSKIFEEYYLRVYKQYSSVIVGEVKKSFFLYDYEFSMEILCEAVEIYQILLSYKKNFNINIQKSKPWWTTDDLGIDYSNYNIIDTYVFLQKKFILIQQQILEHYASLLADFCESRRMESKDE